MATRIDISLSEQGAATAVREIEQLADACQKISPRLAASLRGKALRLGQNVEKQVQQAAVTVLETVVRTTPVDTGKARRNWSVAINKGRPPSTELETTDPSGESTIAEGALKILTTKRQPGEVVWISNAAPYIERLNEGWSAQAPAGFVELAVQAGVASVRRGKKGLLK
jgi:hypothetical protein